MKKQLQVLGSWNELGDFEPTHVYINEEVAYHELNEGKDLEVGYMALDGGGSDCNPKCPPDTLLGYYDCVGGKCVYFLYS